MAMAKSDRAAKLGCTTRLRTGQVCKVSKFSGNVLRQKWMTLTSAYAVRGTAIAVLGSKGLKTTGLVGLKVVRNPTLPLKKLYDKIFRVLSRMPENAAYRKYTMEIIGYRRNIVEKACKAEDIEDKIDCGQCEELIKQAERELDLARKMLKWKPWENLIAVPPPNQWQWPPPTC